jgi:hypothetical protein
MDAFEVDDVELLGLQHDADLSALAALDRAASGLLRGGARSAYPEEALVLADFDAEDAAALGEDVHGSMLCQAPGFEAMTLDDEAPGWVGVMQFGGMPVAENVDADPIAFLEETITADRPRCGVLRRRSGPHLARTLG